MRAARDTGERRIALVAALYPRECVRASDPQRRSDWSRFSTRSIAPKLEALLDRVMPRPPTSCGAYAAQRRHQRHQRHQRARAGNKMRLKILDYSIYSTSNLNRMIYTTVIYYRLQYIQYIQYSISVEVQWYNRLYTRGRLRRSI